MNSNFMAGELDEASELARNVSVTLDAQRVADIANQRLRIEPCDCIGCRPELYHWGIGSVDIPALADVPPN